MNSQDANSCFVSDVRCHHQYANGSRCRLDAPGPDARFCRRHAALPQNRSEAADLGPALTAGLNDFRSAKDLSGFLSRLLLAFSEDRISPRRAAVLAYIASQLLRTLTALEHEAQAKAKAKRELPVTIICDIPRPPYERERSETTL